MVLLVFFALGPAKWLGFAPQCTGQAECSFASAPRRPITAPELLGKENFPLQTPGDVA